MSQDQMLTAGNGKRSLTFPSPEVTPKAKRRTFAAEYKLHILDQASACRTPAERGALLRHEGLYASHLTYWRRELQAGALAGLKPKKRGPKADPLALENARLRREIARLQAQLERAETILEVQKKLSLLLGLPTAPPSNAPNGSPP